MAGIKYTNPALRGNSVRITQGPHGGMKPKSSLDMVKYYSSLDDVIAVASGTVVFAGWSASGYGNRVDIQHDNMITRYAHLANVRVKKGQKVSKGTLLGRMGSTGNSTGAHLHFEVVNTSASPYQVLAGTVKINKVSSTPVSSKSHYGYSVGKTYTIVATAGLKVRTGAGTKYAVKKRSQLTANARKCTKSTSSGTLKYKTKVTCLAVAKVGNDVWIKIPSGWICAKQSTQIYVQ